MTCSLCQKLIQLPDLPKEEVVWEFPHSVAFLGPWQFYTGYCVLVARHHVGELHHMQGEIRGPFMEELCKLSKAIETAFKPAKLNLESLGNQVPHMHWHLFPRQKSDPESKKAVWLALERAEHDFDEKIRLQQGSMPRAEISTLLRHHLENL